MRVTRTTVDENPWPSGWEQSPRRSDRSRCCEPAKEFDASARRHHRLLPPAREEHAWETLKTHAHSVGVPSR
jgi:hypothetical protein